jgi:hypothetical protein
MIINLAKESCLLRQPQLQPGQTDSQDVFKKTAPATEVFEIIQHIPHALEEVLEERESPIEKHV